MKKILQIVDSLEYVETNGFQHQLLKTLQQETDLLTVPITKLERHHLEGRIVLSTLKLRSLVKHVDLLRFILGNIPLYVYDQDPWESHMDEGSYRGSYKMICSKLNVVSFLNPSKWWSDHINSRGSPSKFIKIWILPEYCGSKLFGQRSIDVGFMGQLHPFRKESFESLKTLGVDVATFPGDSYTAYLSKVSDMKFFPHYEPARWHVDGKLIECSALYGKTVEVMARGTFCLREKCVEATHWGLTKNPLLLEFESLEEFVEKVRRVQSLPIEVVDSMIETGVKMIVEDVGWKSVVEAIDEA